MIFDSHIHLNDEKLRNNLDLYLKEAESLGVNKFLCVGYDLDSSKEAIRISNFYDNVYACIGIIPTEFEQFNENTISELKKLAINNKVIAIGEIGLDYYWIKDEESKLKEKEIFIKQIDLANELNLPVSIHARDSLNDVLEILKNHKVNKKGIMHCYSGSLEMSKEFIKLGFKIAFGGVLTFKNSVKNKQVLQGISLKDVVFETDAPYLAPTPFRGKTNEPKYIFETVKFASSILNLDQKTLEDITYNNTLEILNLHE